MGWNVEYMQSSLAVVLACFSFDLAVVAFTCFLASSTFFTVASGFLAVFVTSLATDAFAAAAGFAAAVFLTGAVFFGAVDVLVGIVLDCRRFRRDGYVMDLHQKKKGAD